MLDKYSLNMNKILGAEPDVWNMCGFETCSFTSLEKIVKNFYNVLPSRISSRMWSCCKHLPKPFAVMKQRRKWNLEDLQEIRISLQFSLLARGVPHCSCLSISPWKNLLTKISFITPFLDTGIYPTEKYLLL